MSSMFLDADEIRDLTGRVKNSAQAKALRSLGFTFKVRSDGSLLVLRSHVEQQLGGGQHVTRLRTKEFVPNWEAAVNA